MILRKVKRWHLISISVLILLVFICRSPKFISGVAMQVFFGERLIEESSSPEGKYFAMAVKSGGLFLTPHIGVNIREGQGWFGIGTLKFGTSDDQWVVFAIEDATEIKFDWLDEKTLLVEYTGKMTAKPRDSFKEVHIIYRQIERNNSSSRSN